MENPAITSALVFTRTKHGANRVAKELDREGVNAMAIHGNKSQTARQLALNNFKDGKIRVLVATDIAARGIDVDELSHVINFDIPNIPETYVHRIGRTGRAGLSGIALSFCDVEELPYLRDIQKLTGLRIPIERDHPFHYDPNNPPAPPPKGERPPRRDRPQRGERQDRRDKPKKGKFQHQPKKKKKDRMEGEGQQGRPASEKKNKQHRDDRQQRPERRKNQRDNAPEKDRQTENRDSNDNSASKQDEKKDGEQWSSIFQKPSAGKKGFVIKSDRYDKPRNKSRKPPFRGGKK